VRSNEGFGWGESLAELAATRAKKPRMNQSIQAQNIQAKILTSLAMADPAAETSDKGVSMCHLGVGASPVYQKEGANHVGRVFILD
jgi:hypothetical protein